MKTLRTGLRLNDKEKMRILEDYHNGVSIYQISQLLRRRHLTVTGFLKRAGAWKPKERVVRHGSTFIRPGLTKIFSVECAIHKPSYQSRNEGKCFLDCPKLVRVGIGEIGCKINAATKNGRRVLTI